MIGLPHAEECMMTC